MFSLLRSNSLKRFSLHSHDIDQDVLREMYRLYVRYVDGPQRFQDFCRYIQLFKYASIYRDRSSGGLRGMSFLDVQPKSFHVDDSGKLHHCRVVKGAATYFQEEYHGHSSVYYKYRTALFIKEKLLHPFTPLYIGGMFFTYKLYLVSTKLFKNCYPRYDAKTPDLYKNLISQYASSSLDEGEIFDEEKGLIIQSLCFVKDHVASITDNDLSNPHIEFYARANPHWKDGNALVAVARVTWGDIFLRMVPFIFRRWIRRWFNFNKKTSLSYVH